MTDSTDPEIEPPREPLRDRLYWATLRLTDRLRMVPGRIRYHLGLGAAVILQFDKSETLSKRFDSYCSECRAGLPLDCMYGGQDWCPTCGSPFVTVIRHELEEDGSDA